MSQEARDMPGGATGLFLFLLGSAALFLSGIILVLSGFGSAGFGSGGWVIPLWGGVALVLAVISRKERALLVMTASKIWLAIGFFGLAVIVFGSTVRLA